MGDEVSQAGLCSSCHGRGRRLDEAEPDPVGRAPLSRHSVDDVEGKARSCGVEAGARETGV